MAGCGGAPAPPARHLSLAGLASWALQRVKQPHSLALRLASLHPAALAPLQAADAQAAFWKEGQSSELSHQLPVRCTSSQPFPTPPSPFSFCLVLFVMAGRKDATDRDKAAWRGLSRGFREESARVSWEH